MKEKRLLSLVAILALAATLSGCGSVPVWKRQTFAFETASGPASSTSRTNLVALRSVMVSPLFQGRPFIYRTSENKYEQDPYAAFAVAPERALAEAIRASLRNSGVFGKVLEPGSALTPSLAVEASVEELDGDFRNPSQAAGDMTIHFVIYELNADGPGRILLDKICASQTPLAQRTPAGLIAAWDTNLRKIMEELSSEYAKTHPNDG